MANSLQTATERSFFQRAKPFFYEEVDGIWEKYFTDEPVFILPGLMFKDSEPPYQAFPRLTACCETGRNVFVSRAPGSDSMPAPGRYGNCFLVPVESASKKYSWADVKAIGHFQRARSSDSPAWFWELYDLAFQVFDSQPTRLFLHCLCTCGPLIQVWIFDRTGFYGSTSLSVHDSRRVLLTATTFAMMSDVKLGINPLVFSDDLGIYVQIRDDDAGVEAEPSKFYLEGEPLCKPDDVLDAYPVCYKALRPESDDDVVLKFSWRRGHRSNEEELLRASKDRKVKGVVELVAGKSCVNRTQDIHCGLRLRFDSPSDGVSSVSYPPDLTLSCLAISPVCKPLHCFDSVLELLEAFRDAIEAHRSLYIDGHILHRDISEGNIMITRSPQPREPRGMLIDLDLAWDLTRGAAPAGTRGTRPFVAIGLLGGDRHTYRHDLESFFYVFLWMAVGGGQDPPSTSRLQAWQDNEHAFERKVKDMQSTHFVDITMEFEPEFQGLTSLARSLRDALFQPRADLELFFTGTSEEEDGAWRLYERMIGDFERAAEAERQKATT